ncbi:MAG: DEAD/DEAH box helicase [Desulfobulbaceae bacterium]|nr:DEAD/DEAH box helicase [Desulfobulbaceae bacterium]
MTAPKTPSSLAVTLTVADDACLTGGSPTLIETLKNELTIANPQYQDAKKYGRWIGKRIKPFLYFFSDRKEGFHFPRGFAKQAIQICRQINGELPEIVDLRRELEPVDLSFQGSLRPYQSQALEAILGRDFGVLEAGTGSGKTVIALAVIAARRQPTLVLVHTKELLHQWAERIRTFLGMEAGLIGDGHNEPGVVTVAIVNSARTRLDELTPLFGQICVDECHRVPASLFTEVVTAFPCRYMLGLSATAFRRDGLTKLISIYLGAPVHRVSSHHLHATGAVLKPLFLQRETQFTFAYRGDYQALMTTLTTNEARNRQIVADIKDELDHGDGTLLVVSDRISHCEELALLLEEQGIEAAVLTGALAKDKRTAIVDDVREGRVKVLISTVQLIGEGFDCPGLTTLFLTTPIKFSGRLLQVVGRILRPAEGKQAKVYDYLDPVGVLKSSARARQLVYQEELPL